MNDKETREERLAAALRENLRRRKARARGEADAVGEVQAASTSPDTQRVAD